MSEVPRTRVVEVESSSSSVVERFREHPFAAFETYRYFNQSEETLKQYSEAILSGNTSIVAPEYVYDKIDVDELIRQRDSLTALLQELPIDRQLTLEERLTRENITNRLDEIGIMLLTKMQSELSENDPRYETISFQLGQNLREVYGVPDVDHFKGILGYRLNQLKVIEKRDDVPPAIYDAWEYVKAVLPDDLPIERPYQMKEETMEWYKRQLEERMHPAQVAVEQAVSDGEVVFNDDDELDAENIVKATRIALDARGFHDWGVELTETTQIDTTQSEKKIHIPLSRMMKIAEFNRVIQSHEIDQHVARRENGDASGVDVLQGTGVHGYLAFEEGNGKVNEGLLNGRVENEASAFGYFISGGLALGLDNDGKGRTFRDVHEIVWRMNAIADYLKNGQEDEEAVKKHIVDATKHVNRLFRGTNGRVPGVVFTKDALTYYLGGVEVMRKWDRDMELSQDDRLKEHRLERSAKIYPLRSDHRRLAEKVINESDYDIR